MPDTEQKTRTQRNHPGLRKRQKTDEKNAFRYSANFSSFWTFSQLLMIGLISGLLLCVRHLETQVYSTHKGYFEDRNKWVLTILRQT